MSLRIAEAAKLLKVHPQTLRRWDEEGILVAQKMGNQRRYTMEQLKPLIKADENNEETHLQKVNIIYCRVSSAKQSEDLQRQIAFMQKLFPDYEVIEDIASGVNFHRPGFSKLLERVCSDEIGKITVSFKDRLARIGFEIFEQICSIHNCEIIVVNNIETSPEGELVEDLVAIITSFSARIHGLRKYSEKVNKNYGPVEDI
jgi:excisionase family DNA binding protein